MSSTYSLVKLMMPKRIKVFIDPEFKHFSKYKAKLKV